MSLFGWLFGRKRRKVKNRSKAKKFTRSIKSKHKGGKATRTYVKRARSSAQRKAAKRSARTHARVLRTGGFNDWSSDDPYGFFS